VDKWLEGQRIDLGGMRDLTNFINDEDALQSAIQKHSLGLMFDGTRSSSRCRREYGDGAANGFGRDAGPDRGVQGGQPDGQVCRGARRPGAWEAGCR